MRRKLVVSTTDSLQNATVREYLGVISSHVVAGTGLFSDIFASFSDIFGGRSASYQKQLAAIDGEVVDLLSAKAIEMGANCLVGLRVDHDEVSGSGKSMFMVTATGTAAVADFGSREHSPDQSSRQEVSASRLEVQIEKSRLLSRLQNGLQRLTDEQWSFVIHNEVAEVAPFVLSAVNSIRFWESGHESDEQLKKRVREYFFNLPAETAQDVLLEGAVSDEGNERRMAIELLKELQLLDLQRLQQYLQDDEKETRIRALHLVNCEKQYYSRDDLPTLTRIRELVSTQFPEVGERFVKKGLVSSSREMWRCECGEENELDSRCARCSKDIRGFKKGDVSPDEASTILEEQITTLKSLLNRE